MAGALGSEEGRQALQDALCLRHHPPHDLPCGEDVADQSAILPRNHLPRRVLDAHLNPVHAVPRHQKPPVPQVGDAVARTHRRIERHPHRRRDHHPEQNLPMKRQSKHVEQHRSE